jgi:hypothetical protein
MLSRTFGATGGSTQRSQTMMFATYLLAKFTVGRCIFHFTLCCLLIKFGSRYCACLFRERAPDHEIRYYTPLRLAVDAIMRFRPRQLSDPPRSLAGNTFPLEDQYQKEFYRCLFTILDGHVVTSPEFVVKNGTKGGTIDFLIGRKKWGLELLRDRDRLVEHMKRFEPGGQYFSMIRSREMEQYIVLDFTVKQPTKPHPGNTPPPYLSFD